MSQQSRLRLLPFCWQPVIPTRYSLRVHESCVYRGIVHAVVLGLRKELIGSEPLNKNGRFLNLGPTFHLPPSSIHRQPQREHRTLAEFALYLQPTSVGFGGPLGDVEPEANSARVAAAA